MKIFHASLFVSTAFALGASPGKAATLVSSTFGSTGLTEVQDIDITGPEVVDWGYFAIDNEFIPGIVDNRKATSGIGTVTVTPGDVATATFMWNDLLPKWTMTFADGEDPTSGTVGIGTGFGAWGPTEDNAASLSFNDLGTGTHTVRVFVGHSSNDRIFNMDYQVTAADGNLTGNSESAIITEGDVHSTYEIVFSTNDPNADLSLQFNSTSGGTGSGWIGGYVVETTNAFSAEPRLTSAVRTGGEPGARQLTLTLKGAPDTAYEFRSSTTLDFDTGTLLLNLSQNDPSNNPGTISGVDDSLITTDSNGDAVVQVVLTGNPADFVRAEKIPAVVE